MTSYVLVYDSEVYKTQVDERKKRKTMTDDSRRQRENQCFSSRVVCEKERESDRERKRDLVLNARRARKTTSNCSFRVQIQI